jgi:FkbM family methyltransferase
MSVAIVKFEGLETSFHVENPLDHIQQFHSRGEFYEIRQLLAHRDLIARRTTILDVGANVGNHTLFYARHTKATRVYPLEPNPAAIEILTKNLESNPDRCAVIDQRYLGLAVGASSGHARLEKSTENNLGGTSFARTSDNEGIRMMPLDTLEFDGPVGFVKIDVEGAEIDVLKGAERLIAKDRPSLAIEVDRRNDAMFWGWARARGYQVIGAFFDYVPVKNYVLIPTA